DVHLPFMSLPHVLGIGDGDHLAGAVPYLSPPATARITVPDGEGPVIGLVWSGRQSPGNLRRSCPAQALAPLLALPGLRFVSAQVDASAEDLALLAAHGVTTPTDDIRDFGDLAGLLAGLDLLLTIDSAPAHLAGAMGLPVWTMLAHGADWRWFLDRADSPWYPTMRLFRQRREGDWPGLVEDVAAALTRFPWLVTPAKASSSRG
ncbi:MAG: glycosyltransferase, partial [Alphaproteobacteria bacterium]|nr:glycosyltransferase [Alphaproteobacteria bacterium]